MFKSVLIVGLGGFIGSALRYLITRCFQLHATTSFPWGTFVVNITGSLLIGILFGLSEKGSFLSREWNIFLTIGLCGGFTTFSTFSNDAFLLLREGELLSFIAYTALSFFLGIAAVFFGYLIVKA